MNKNLSIVNNKEKKQFEYRQGTAVARLQYGFYKDDIAFMHIDVPSSMEGTGVASALTDFAFDYAKEVDKKVMVYCAFVAKHVKRNPALRPQLDKKYHPY